MIKNINIKDKRFNLKGAAGSDAVHTNPVYSYAVTELIDDAGITGTGFAFSLGEGNELVCQAANYYAKKLLGRDIEETMSSFGLIFKGLADDQQFRWLGPQKGIVHLALASVTNACFDLWAKKRQVPLWKLLIDLSPTELINTLDLSYLEDILSREEALNILNLQNHFRNNALSVIKDGYPGYDTSVGWFNFSDKEIEENCKKALNNGFTAIKLKVGSSEANRDIRRANLIRELAGDNITIMLDANQQWNVPQAIDICYELKKMNPYWLEEPTHPDDILAHKIIAEAITPIKLAVGEHLPNKLIFKNYFQTNSISFAQVDAVRVGGVSEFITISLLAKKFEIPVVPHVGDMGQLHQHLVLFNHISLGHKKLFLEHIPHLKENFLQPISIENGVYLTPMEPGSSCDFIL